jgi:hypothetical protein
LIWALLMPVGLGSVLFLYRAASLIGARYGLEYGEGIVLWQAAHVFSPSEAYHPISQYPYVVFHYPPAFHVMSRSLGVVTGDLLVAGRLVTFCSVLGSMLVLGAMVFRGQSGVADRPARWLGAIAAALLVPALPNVRDWVPPMRVDMFGLMLTLLSMWAFIEGQKRPALRYLAFIGFVAALFTKQTLISAPLAALLATAMDDRTEALKLAGVAALAGSIPLLGMQYATNGQFVTHLFLYNQNTYTVRRAVEMMTANVWNTLPVLALALAAVLFRFAETRRRATGRSDSGDLTAGCLSLYLVFAFLISWTSGKYGSASNYFLEFNLICCFFAGLAVTKAMDQSRLVPMLARVTIGLLVVLAGARWLPMIADDTPHLPAGPRSLAAARAAEASQALELVRRVPGPVFSWDLMVLMLAEKDIPLEPAIMFELSRAGKWDIAPFLEEIREGYYGLIVANSDAEWLTSEPVTRAMAAAYAPAEQFGSYHFYRPVRR